MFVVFKQREWPAISRKVPCGTLKFPTYEAARQWVRKHLRKTATVRNFWWRSNPQIGDYGYSIKKVN